MTAPIVVGVYGSESCRAALEWALTEAVLRRCPVEAVSVTTANDRLIELRFGPSTYAVSARDQVASAATRHPSVPLRHTWLIGSPALTLVRAARDAAMLVLGSHGTGRRARGALGSMSEYCSKHAECPVVLVVAGRRDNLVAPVSTPRGASHRGN